MKQHTPVKALLIALARWFDNSAGGDIDPYERPAVDWVRCLPFAAMHLAMLGVIWVGWSRAAVITAVTLYFARMLAITGFYHRYFSHKTFRTSRWFQFVMAVIGNTSVQRSPLWWAAHHRFHHLNADLENDIHSPRRHGLLWSHIGWVTSKTNFNTRRKLIPDFTNYPELLFLDRFDTIVPVIFAVSIFGFGVFLEKCFPALGTNGMQMLVWGFVISTVFLFHGTFTINSLSHKFGTRRYPTKDDSRNNFLLSLVTLGEGWHNNHHHYSAATRQGFFWWEIDITYYFLLLLNRLGLIWDLKSVPEEVRNGTRSRVALSA